MNQMIPNRRRQVISTSDWNSVGDTGCSQCERDEKQMKGRLNINKHRRSRLLKIMKKYKSSWKYRKQETREEPHETGYRKKKESLSSLHCCWNAFNVSFKAKSVVEINCESMTFLSNLPTYHTCWFTSPFYIPCCSTVLQSTPPQIIKKKKKKNRKQLLVSCWLSIAIRHTFIVRFPHDLLAWWDTYAKVCACEKVHPLAGSLVGWDLCVCVWLRSFCEFFFTTSVDICT